MVHHSWGPIWTFLIVGLLILGLLTLIEIEIIGAFWGLTIMVAVIMILFSTVLVTWRHIRR